MVTLPDEALEALARAYDREDAAQHGEPSPWIDSDDAWRAERLACARAGIEALDEFNAALSHRTPAPAVKALEWTDDGVRAFADTIIGRYKIKPDGDEPRRLGSYWRDDWLIRTYSDRDEAKAAAQADYEQRIRSALSPVSSPEPVAYLHEVKEPDLEKTFLLSKAPDNPWSHWLKEYRGKCVYTCTPLYATPPEQAQPEPVGEVLADGVFWYKKAATDWFPTGTKLFASPLLPSPKGGGNG